MRLQWTNFSSIHESKIKRQQRRDKEEISSGGDKIEKGGRKFESGQGRKAQRKIEERTDWKKNLEPWGSRSNRMHGRLRRKCSEKARCTGRDPGK